MFAIGISWKTFQNILIFFESFASAQLLVKLKTDIDH